MSAFIWSSWSRTNDQRIAEAPVPSSKSRKERVKRNDPCPFGSGKKYKKCCLDRY
ncbi:MAG: SEC-C domain-containing protein [Desulfohalobiaceae bacterium]|nr:SEC-C domain-containing protein [Desulfohalobiaceae bacterium]